ncbi:hypothetical protein, partial [Burkholderia sp.]|uniref:hypothetical protein n=1 Tax=Burkholderia sp. TaxID=36773 RepID=UPI00258C08FA
RAAVNADLGATFVPRWREASAWAEIHERGVFDQTELNRSESIQAHKVIQYRSTPDSRSVK